MTKTQLNINVDMTDSSTVAVAMFSAMELKAKQREAKYLRYFRVFCSSIGWIVEGSVQMETIGQSMAWRRNAGTRRYSV